MVRQINIRFNNKYLQFRNWSNDIVSSDMIDISRKMKYILDILVGEC